MIQLESIGASLRTRSFFLLFEEGQKRDIGHFHHLETNTCPRNDVTTFRKDDLSRDYNSKLQDTPRYNGSESNGNTLITDVKI